MSQTKNIVIDDLNNRVMNKIIITGRQGKTTYVNKMTKGKSVLTFIPTDNKAYSDVQRLFQERTPEYLVIEDANVNNDFCEKLFSQDLEFLLFKETKVLVVMQHVPSWAMNRSDILIVDVYDSNYTNSRVANVLTNKPFTVISSQDDNIRLWVPSKCKDRALCCPVSFNALNYTEFIDQLDKLMYLQVQSVSAVDEELSYIEVLLKEDNCLEEFIEDLPELLYQYVECHDKHQAIHSGGQQVMD